VFERFTDRSRRVLVLAQDEAQLLSHNFIGTEHILLGLIHEGEGVAAKALESLGLSLDAVRAKVQETIGPVASSSTGSPPFTPRAKRVLELSLREALQLGHNYIGTEHMLLGLVREGEGVATQVLVSLGAELGRVRQAVTDMLSGFSGGEVAQPATAEPTLEIRREAVKPEDPPRCPHCRAGLADKAAFRTIDVSSDAGDESVRVIFVYCSLCGLTLFTRLRE
jgi:ATP-dependent Clp protease ATP-binding subunit ClpA